MFENIERLYCTKREEQHPRNFSTLNNVKISYFVAITLTENPAILSAIAEHDRNLSSIESPAISRSQSVNKLSS